MNPQAPTDLYFPALDLARSRAPVEGLLPLMGALTLLHAARVFPEQMESLGVKTPPELAERLDALTLDSSTIQNLMTPLLDGHAPVADLGLHRLPEELLGRLSRLIGLGVGRVALQNAGSAGLRAIGKAYTHLLEQGSRFDEHVTPGTLAELGAHLLEVRPGMRVLDFALGFARTLVALADHLRGQGHDPNSVEYVGQEVNSSAAAIAACHLLLNGVSNFTIHVDNTLMHPATPVRAFDRVIADPPFNLSITHRGHAWELDPRFSASPNLPRTADWLFVQHGLTALKPGGRAVLIVPHGPLFRGGAERDIREFYATAGWLNAIISLPSALYSGVTLPVVVTVFDRPLSSDARNHDMLMIDAAGLGSRRGRQNVLSPEVIARLVKLVKARTEDADPPIHQAVTLERLGQNDHAWQPNQYIRRVIRQGRDLAQIREDLETAMRAATTAQQRVSRALKALGPAPAPSGHRPEKIKEQL